MRRWPKPGARIAVASIVPCWLFCTSMPSAAPSTFSARMISGSGRRMTWPIAPMSSCTDEIGCVVISTYGFSSTVSIRIRSRMRYGDMCPFSTCSPSTNSTAMPGSSLSSMLTTPSSPTRSSASATARPMRSSSFAAIVATWLR